MKKKSISQSAFFKLRVLSAFLVLLSVQLGHAGSATWALNPQSGDWNNPANWVPNTVPNGPNDVARFRVSNVTNITTSADVEVAGIVFMPGASSYYITDEYPHLLVGAGVTNNSGVVQNFVADAGAAFQFENTASAGNLTTYTINGGTVSGESGGTIEFDDSSNAGSATLIANGGTNGAAPGMIQFRDFSTGGSCNVVLHGGTLDVTVTNEERLPLSLTSLEGDSGSVLLGGNELNLSPSSGPKPDNDFCTISGRGGSLTKSGTGTVILGGANTYTGGTTVREGTLLLRRNGNSSQTGTGNVLVTAGTLGGDGIVAGNLIIGDGSGARATVLGVEDFTQEFFTAKRRLSFRSDGDYNWQVNSDDLTAGMVVARGVTIASGAQFLASDIGTSTFPQGMVFTIIKNTSQSPIRGTFGNLPDGSLLTVGVNTLLISYHGGTSGRDLTGTVQ